MEHVATGDPGRRQRDEHLARRCHRAWPEPRHQSQLLLSQHAAAAPPREWARRGRPGRVDGTRRADGDGVERPRADKRPADSWGSAFRARNDPVYEGEVSPGPRAGTLPARRHQPDDRQTALPDLIAVVQQEADRSAGGLQRPSLLLVGAKGSAPRRRHRQLRDAEHQLHPRDAHPPRDRPAGSQDHETADRHDRGVAPLLSQPSPVGDAQALSR